MRWIASGEDLSFAMDGERPGQISPDALHVAIGAEDERLPAPVLPADATSLPALRQVTPPDAISAWVRVWLAGFLDGRGDWDGVVCALHGDLSHWLHVSAKEIVSAQSFLSPRLIAALGGAEAPGDTALAEGLSRPERLASLLRIADLLGDGAAITGALIGAELAAARPYWLGRQVAVIGDTPLLGAYAQALMLQGAPTERLHVDDVRPPGLAALARALRLAG